MIADKELKTIKEKLNNGDVIAFPTETVMGLGVVFDNEEAYKKINLIKKRPEDKPYTMMLGDINEIAKYAHLSHRDEIIINEFMPGPLTILLNSKENVPGYVTHNTGVIGIRVPAHKEVCEMINYVGKPLLVPSANKSGEKPCLTYKEIEKVFNNELGFILKMDSNQEKPSTIIDLTSKDIKIIREGNISLEDINRRIAMKKIVIASDHGGYDYKAEIISFLTNSGYEVIDVGTNSTESTHYPDYAIAAAKKVSDHIVDFGILICTSGEGMVITANKVKGIRCGLGYNDEVSALMRQHNDANMIAFSQKFMDIDDIKKRITIFLSTDFEGGRHQIRVDKIKDLEK